MRRDSDKYAEEHAHDDDKSETIDDLMKDENIDAGEGSGNTDSDNKPETEGKDKK